MLGCWGISYIAYGGSEDFYSFFIGLLLNMLGLDLVVEEVEDAILIVLVVADLETIDEMLHL